MGISSYVVNDNWNLRMGFPMLANIINSNTLRQDSACLRNNPTWGTLSSVIGQSYLFRSVLGINGYRYHVTRGIPLSQCYSDDDWIWAYFKLSSWKQMLDGNCRYYLTLKRIKGGSSGYLKFWYFLFEKDQKKQEMGL